MVVLLGRLAWLLICLHLRHPNDPITTELFLADSDLANQLQPSPTMDIINLEQFWEGYGLLQKNGKGQTATIVRKGS